MDHSLYRLFKEPPSEYRGKPFWAWNGELERDELLRQIHVFKEMGFGGFFMHSRTGLVTEYLGEEWFELVRECAEEAEKLGMEAWLYDEDRWPSGSAGGLVAKEPRYRMKFIRMQTEAPESFQWNESVIAAFTCKLDGFAYFDCKRLAIGERPETAGDQTVLFFSIEEMAKDSFYNGYTYTDTLNLEATEKFLALTHEKYKQACGSMFGRGIKGIFIDEPHRGAVMDGFGIGNDNPEWHVPWTYTLFEQFEEAFGYDLVSRLPELFLWPEGKRISQVKWHYVELLQRMFLENFAKPIDEWCRSNGLILTGHVLHEDNLTSQAAMNGSVMRYYEHMEYPGVDVLSESNANYWIVKQLSSAARQLGRTWLLSELYGCTGWQMPLEAHKAVGAWQALFGINLRCPHLAWYTMEGQSKRDYPASLSHHSAWWREYEHVESYFSRLGVIMTHGKPSCDILVLNPVESVWCRVYPGWSRGLIVQSPEVQKLEDMYRDTFHWLAGAQLDFDYGDEEMMGRLCRVAHDESNRPVLQFGVASYKAVVVAGMTTIRSTTIALLEAFRQVGGHVIFAGEPPSYVDALESQVCLELAAGCVRIPHAKEPLVASCSQVVEHRVAVEHTESSQPIEDIYCQIRQDDDTLYVVLLNMNRERNYQDVSITVNVLGEVEEWDCVNGERRAVRFDTTNGAIRILSDFAPAEEHVYAISPTYQNELSVPDKYEDRSVVQLNGPYAYSLAEPNVCVLDMASYRIDDGEWQGELEILKLDRALRDRFGIAYRGGNMVQPWYADKYLERTVIPLCKLELMFSFSVAEMEPGQIHLVLERPERFKVSINDRVLPIPEHPDWWVDLSMKKVPIPAEELRLGDNFITLETEFHPGINLEAIYLIGPFGVYLDGSRKMLEKLPEKLEAGCITQQGLAFYSGALTYLLEPDTVPAPSPASQETGAIYSLSFPAYAAACMKVKSAIRHSPSLIAWQPNEADVTEECETGTAIEVEVVLTRRNTFGPLHEVPLYTIEYGPYSFVTEGEFFSANYMLVPAGLLHPPRIILRQPVKKHVSLADTDTAKEL
ncbi:hypothetical protein [Paenibacillus contaminans]|uniref:Glycoside hydrolase n=1 Tax=Paenibacillus contaminans TaxID=450362 RepID=A0A329MIG8_9BACL|nr:hypothetical protein [Paenibacillus contaminans]RAV19156.1 hypothetical protein DQG23_21695 [Paenibacillus contaminans]